MQALAQIGVVDLVHAGAGGRLFLFHGCFGREAAVDILFHAPHPAFGIGEHAVGFKHFELFPVAVPGAGQHLIDAHAQGFDRLVQPCKFAHRIVGDGVGNDDARLVQPDMALRGAFLRAGAAKQNRLAVAGGHCRALADECAQFGHFGQHHGDHLDGIDLFVRKQAGLLRLHDKHAQLFAEALDRHAHERAIGLFAGFGHVSKSGRGRGVIGIDHLARARDAAHQPLAETHPGLVDGLGFQALGGAKLQRVLVAEQVYRTDLGVHLLGDEPGDLVEPRLSARVLGHDGAQAAQHLAAVGLGRLGHCGQSPGAVSVVAVPPAQDRRVGVRPLCPVRRHHAALVPQVPCISGR